MSTLRAKADRDDEPSFYLLYVTAEEGLFPFTGSAGLASCIRACSRMLSSRFFPPHVGLERTAAVAVAQPSWAGKSCLCVRTRRACERQRQRRRRRRQSCVSPTTWPDLISQACYTRGPKVPYLHEYLPASLDPSRERESLRGGMKASTAAMGNAARNC